MQGANLCKLAGEESILSEQTLVCRQRGKKIADGVKYTARALNFDERIKITGSLCIKEVFFFMITY